MLQRAVNFCKGHVTVRVEGGFPERVLNLCAARQINFWNLNWETPISFTFTMTRKSFRELKKHQEKLGAEMQVVGKSGLPFFARRFRRRRVLMAGLGLCTLLLLTGSFFIWDIQIEGNVNVSQEEILRVLDQYGVGMGSYAFSIHSEQLRNQILLEIPELSYIAVNVSGSRAYVQVRERTPKPELVNKRQPGNTVAARDGLITAVQPYDGEKLVLPGTMVQEGQLLISGVTDDEQAGTRFLRGMGKVYARTWHKIRCQVPGSVREKVYTGEEHTRYAICWGAKRINFYNSSSIPWGDCDKIVTRTKLTLPGGIALPITVVKETYRCYEEQTVERSQEEAEQAAYSVRKAYLTGSMEEGQVEHETLTAVPWGDDLLVELSAECQEQIGRFVEIEKE